MMNRISRTMTVIPACLALAGCASTPAGPAAGQATGAEDRFRLTGTEQDQAVKDLEALYRTLKDPEPSMPRGAEVLGPPTKRTTARPPRTVEPGPVSEPMGPPASLALAAAAPTAAAAAAPSPEQRQGELVSELIDLLRARAAGGADPAGDAALITLLSSLDPAGAQRALEGSGVPLDPTTRQTLAALRDLARELPSTAGRDPDEVARLLDRVARQLGGQALTIPTVALCSKVESFGRYTPLPSSTFLAGRAHPAIVYTEVANFVHQPAGAVREGAEEQGGEWIVQLSQEISLYHRDGTLAWRKPAETVRDVSRNIRRDYYLVRRIDLPATLTVGSYNLKVTVRDLGGQGTMERVVPISIVADPGLASGGGAAEAGGR